MKQYVLPACAAVLMLSAPLVARAQTTTATSTVTMSVPEFHEFSAATATNLANIGTGLNPLTSVLTSTGQNHQVTVETNSSTGVDVDLELASTTFPSGATDAWDNVTVTVSGTSSTVATALTGSSDGTITTRNYTANATNEIVSDIIGGSFTYTLTYTVTLGSRYALEGSRSFTATYTVAP